VAGLVGPPPRLPGEEAAGGAAYHHHHAGRPGALALLRSLAAPAAALARLDCGAALAALAALPLPHRTSAWALALGGRARAEAVDYPGAASAFSAAAAADPAGLEGVAHHSTVLWHLRRRAEAAALAVSALATDRRSPSAWVAAGNALSLAGEPARALAAFRRAVALDPGAPYAHTLAGHEHAAAGDADAAVACFRAALHLDARHYNAWWVVGRGCGEPFISFCPCFFFPFVRVFTAILFPECPRFSFKK
jgi:anaphase-promoting complex subunit 3